MTTFQKINRKRWPTWARMTLLALAAAMVLVLLLPGIVASEHGTTHAQTEVLPHVGGGAIEDCTYAETNSTLGAFSTDAYAFTSNPARDEGVDIEVFMADGTVVAGWTIAVSNVTRTSFDWALNGPGGEVESDQGLRAPGNNRSISHVAWCLGEGPEDSYSVIAVEVKGSQDTLHHFYPFSCGSTEVFSENYAATFNCITKGSVRAFFTQTDEENTGDGIDTVLLETFGTGSAVYIEYINFGAQPAALAGPVPFILMYDDVAPFGYQPPGDPAPPVAAPQCLYNPDVDGNGIVDDLDGDGEGNGDATNPTDVDDNDLAADAADGVFPAGDTTCYFFAQFTQDEDGDWASSFGVANIGDGWRTIY